MQDSGVSGADRLVWEAFSAAPSGIALAQADPGGNDLRLVRVNPAAERLLGLAPDRVQPPPLAGCVHPDHRDAVRDAVRDVIAREIPVARAEVRPNAPAAVWLELEIYPLGEPGAATESAVVRIFDVSDRRWERRAEQVRETVSQALSQAISVDGAISAVLPPLADTLGFSTAAAWRAQEDADEMICVGQWCRSDVRVPAFSAANRELRIRAGQGLPGAARATKQITTTEDLARMPDDPRAPCAAQDDLHGAVAVAVTAPGQPPVVLEFLTSEAGPVDHRAVAIVEELGPRIAAGLAEKAPRRPSRAGEVMLLVEDNPFIARLIDEMLDANRIALGLEHVERLSDALDWLASRRPACIVLDLTLPDADGLQALLEIRRRAPEAPVVVLTGLEDQDLAERSLAEGAQDYLVKSRVDMHGLARAVHFAIQRKGAEREALERRLHDSVTGLPNRVLFLDRLRMARLHTDGDAVSVAVLNVDHFRRINDTLGHEAGDRVLVEIAHRIGSSLEAGETLSSLGADEFAMIIDSTNASRVVRRVSEIVDRMTAGLAIDGIEVSLSVSAGVALDPGLGSDEETLLQHAESALTLSKQSGDVCSVYDEGVRARLRERLQVEADLRRAVDAGELRAYYQPIVELKGRRLVGFEALVRWRHPERGLLPPAAFLEVAEESGLIVPLGAWMLDEACAQLARWVLDPGIASGLRMNVNLSARELGNDRVVERVAAALARTRIDPAALCLEVTESSLIEDLETSLRVLGDLKALGVRLALDDFGTGYSSLTYLERFPVDMIKLDRAFVVGLREGRHPAVVAGVANIAEAMALDAVAEGIEHEEEVELLLNLGYGFGQGYAFGRPAPADEVGRLLGGPVVHEHGAAA